MFSQWYFELTQGFSLLFYGVGSKRGLLLDFISSTIPPEIPVLVANGYNPSVSFKELLNSITPILVPDYKSLKFPKNTPDLLQALLDYLDEQRKKTELTNFDDTNSPKVVVLINNINGESLRSEKVQSYLARLFSAKEVWFIASIDNINASMLWDAAKLAIFNFLWHDVTTFESYAIETSFDDPLSLGSVRTAAGSKGVKYVLSSLTPKARGLYKVLIHSQIEIMSLNGGDINIPGSIHVALEMGKLYQKCLSEFLVSNEMNFRTMLTEFIDHKMIVLTKDNSGTELVFIPYTKEAMEKIIEEGFLDN
ncbi:uncharacterized protein SAPINGB_P006480 [Magnusiomyces paraingens]|uniref:Origin recognition complex subunit 2 n=1 Tax=Magnusiomyces paraingens TaxID=2606893 RepID=A0A5E8C572_9ASCO|nr:uncharacterized protein SAPINGB_P006480 [Saprochaete ingens]VVT58979.1 unnamed protein product [Saprochaete ingens]